MKKIISIAFIATLAITSIFADNFDSLFETDDVIETTSPLSSDSLFDDDSLFGDSSNLFETQDSSTLSPLNLSDDLLTSEVAISGSYSFNFETGLTYDFDTSSSPTYYAESDISTEIQLSARPTTDTRFFIKTSLSFPFKNVEDNPSTPLIDEEYNFFEVEELFYDFIVSDEYYFRVGKQTLNMGVGYFYSPANLLNISSIDPLDPEEDQEGPLAIKVNRPLGNDNLYGYVTLPDESDYNPEDLGFAARYEKVIGKGEYTLSGYYAYDQATSPSKIALTLSNSIFTDIDIFAEAVESYDGSDFYFSGTAGIQILKNIEDLVDTSVTFIAQYYYDQDGVSTYNSISYDATHQLAGLLSLSLPNDYGISLYSINVLKESSGVVSGNLWYDVNDDINLSVGALYNWGTINSIKPYISLTLGSGDF